MEVEVILHDHVGKFFRSIFICARALFIYYFGTSLSNYVHFLGSLSYQLHNTTISCKWWVCLLGVWFLQYMLGVCLSWSPDSTALVLPEGVTLDVTA